MDEDWTKTPEKELENEDEHKIQIHRSLRITAASPSSIPSNLLDFKDLGRIKQAYRHDSVITVLDFDKTGKILMTAGLDKTLCLYRMEGQNNDLLKRIFITDLPIKCSKFTFDGKEIIITGQRPFIYSFNLINFKIQRINKLVGRDERSWEYFEVSPNNKHIIFVAVFGVLIVVSRKTKKPVKTIHISDPITMLKFNFDGSKMFILTQNAKIYVFDMNTYRCVDKILFAGIVKAMSFDIFPALNVIAIGCNSGVLTLYHYKFEKDSKFLLDTKQIYKEKENENDVAVKEIYSINNLVTTVEGIEFNHDGQLMVYWSRQKRNAIRLVHVETGKVYQNWPNKAIQHVCKAKFSPNSGCLVIGDDTGKVNLVRLLFYECLIFPYNMLPLRLLQYTRKAPYRDIIRIHIVGLWNSNSYSFEINGHDMYKMNSKVIYPKKHENHNKSLSSTQMKFYRDAIHQIQTFLQNEQIAPDSSIDLSVILGINSEFEFDAKKLNELKKWLQKMPNINMLTDNQLTRDYHIESIDFVSNNYASITWKNQLHFKTHSPRKYDSENTINHIKELINYYQLHSVFNKHSVESKMIISRGLNKELTNAYINLMDNKIHELDVNDYHHLLGNLGLNILSYFNDKLCKDPNKDLLDLHNDLIHNKILSINDIKCRYNNELEMDKYNILCEFLIEYYSLYFRNRNEYSNLINGETQKISNLDVMPFLFEMKTLMKIGKLLDYINTYYNRLIYNAKYKNESYYFDIHYNERDKYNKSYNKLFNKEYRVYSERQLENGDCLFSVDKCTPDILLSQPVWINKKPIYWFDAKCTKAANCIYDKKRHYQMYRFTKNYGSGAILALGSADLSIVGINDVIILDCSHYL